MPPGSAPASQCLASTDLVTRRATRMRSSRFPGKMMTQIAGEPMIVHTFRRASEAALPSRVLVATDSEEIAAAVRAVGGEALLTDPGHTSGTDRQFYHSCFPSARALHCIRRCTAPLSMDLAAAGCARLRGRCRAASGWLSTCRATSRSWTPATSTSSSPTSAPSAPRSRPPRSRPPRPRAGQRCPPGWARLPGDRAWARRRSFRRS